MSTEDATLVASLRHLARRLREDDKPMSANLCERAADRLQQQAASIEGLADTYSGGDSLFARIFGDLGGR